MKGAINFKENKELTDAEKLNNIAIVNHINQMLYDSEKQIDDLEYKKSLLEKNDNNEYIKEEIEKLIKRTLIEKNEDKNWLLI